ncbi:Glutamate receptor U1 [Echinococcus granulosus]|uniref:Glutamate receptor U1 n=1 Tax=Echinococcus granulosus TaxID=6210 RepID=W6UF56_ECHGR|nr:Glutamate receptor U1 [Echinococcus granulosus]EUB60050.1 Glutamate receptor U1 [Echinococcus granulosus]
MGLFRVIFIFALLAPRKSTQSVVKSILTRCIYIRNYFHLYTCQHRNATYSEVSPSTDLSVRPDSEAYSNLLHFLLNHNLELAWCPVRGVRQLLQFANFAVDTSVRGFCALVGRRLTTASAYTAPPAISTNGVYTDCGYLVLLYGKILFCFPPPLTKEFSDLPVSEIRPMFLNELKVPAPRAKLENQLKVIKNETIFVEIGPDYFYGPSFFPPVWKTNMADINRTRSVGFGLSSDVQNSVIGAAFEHLTSQIGIAKLAYILDNRGCKCVHDKTSIVDIRTFQFLKGTVNQFRVYHLCDFANVEGALSKILVGGANVLILNVAQQVALELLRKAEEKNILQHPFHWLVFNAGVTLSTEDFYVYDTNFFAVEFSTNGKLTDFTELSALPKPITPKDLIFRDMAVVGLQKLAKLLKKDVSPTLPAASTFAIISTFTLANIAMPPTQKFHRQQICQYDLTVKPIATCSTSCSTITSNWPGVQCEECANSSNSQTRPVAEPRAVECNPYHRRLASCLSVIAPTRDKQQLLLITACSRSTLRNPVPLITSTVDDVDAEKLQQIWHFYSYMDSKFDSTSLYKVQISTNGSISGNFQALKPPPERGLLLSRMRRKPLRLGTVVVPPVITEEIDANGAVTLRGAEIVLAKELLGRLNVSYNITVFDTNFGEKVDGRWTNIFSHLEQWDIDLLVGPFSETWDRMISFRSTTPIRSIAYNFMYFRPSLSALTQIFQFVIAFDASAWLLIFLATVSIGVALALIHKISPNTHGFSIHPAIIFVFGYLFQGVRTRPPSQTSSQILIVVWWFFCLILVIAFCANYAAYRSFTALKTLPTTIFTLLHQEYYKYAYINGSNMESMMRVPLDPTIHALYTEINTKFRDMIPPNRSAGIDEVIKVL